MWQLTWRYLRDSSGTMKKRNKQNVIKKLEEKLAQFVETTHINIYLLYVYIK